MLVGEPPPPGFFVEFGFGDLVLRPPLAVVGDGDALVVVVVPVGVVEGTVVRDVLPAGRVAVVPVVGSGVADRLGDGVPDGATGPVEVRSMVVERAGCAPVTLSSPEPARSGARPTTSAVAVRIPAAVETTRAPLRRGALCLPIGSVWQPRSGRRKPAADPVGRHLGVLVGFGVGATPRPGLVRVGVGDGIGAADEAVVVVAVPDVPAAVVVGVGTGTTRTSGVPAVAVGVGAGVVSGAGPRVPWRDVDEVGTASGSGPPAEAPPTAQATPAEPITAAAPSTRTGA